MASPAATRNKVASEKTTMTFAAVLFHFNMVKVYILLRLSHYE